MMRYKVKYGKFGAYFYDTKLLQEMTLKEVLATLNTHDVYKEDIQSQFNEVTDRLDHHASMIYDKPKEGDEK